MVHDPPLDRDSISYFLHTYSIKNSDEFTNDNTLWSPDFHMQLMLKKTLYKQTQNAWRCISKQRTATSHKLVTISAQNPSDSA